MEPDHIVMLVPFLIATLIGVMLISQGITGLIVSESCCFGSSCSAENLCDSAKPNIESPSNFGPNGNYNLYLGIFLMITAMAVYLAYLSNHTHKI